MKPHIVWLAERVLNELSGKLEKLYLEEQDIRDQMRVVEQTILSHYGKCKECQNWHWPHCKGGEDG